MILKIKTKNSEMEFSILNKEGNESLTGKLLKTGLMVMGAMTVVGLAASAGENNKTGE